MRFSFFSHSTWHSTRVAVKVAASLVIASCSSAPPPPPTTSLKTSAADEGEDFPRLGPDDGTVRHSGTSENRSDSATSDEEERQSRQNRSSRSANVRESASRDGPQTEDPEPWPDPPAGSPQPPSTPPDVAPRGRVDVGNLDGGPDSGTPAKPVDPLEHLLGPDEPEPTGLPDPLLQFAVPRDNRSAPPSSSPTPEPQDPPDSQGSSSPPREGSSDSATDSEAPAPTPADASVTCPDPFPARDLGFPANDVRDERGSYQSCVQAGYFYDRSQPNIEDRCADGQDGRDERRLAPTPCCMEFLTANLFLNAQGLENFRGIQEEQGFQVDQCELEDPAQPGGRFFIHFVRERDDGARLDYLKTPKPLRLRTSEDGAP